MGVRTRGDRGDDRLAPALVPEGHQVDGVLLPGTQAALQEGGDGAGQLSRHSPVVVLEVEGETHRSITVGAGWLKTAFRCVSIRHTDGLVRS